MNLTKEYLLNFDSSLHKVSLVLWGMMMITYYSGASGELSHDQVSMAIFFCGGTLGVKEDFVLPLFFAIFLTIALVVIFIAWGVYPTKIPQFSPKGVSVSAAAFLVAALSFFLAVFFFPCAEAGLPGNGMGLAKFGGGAVALVQNNFLIYSLLHSIFMGCFYRGCVISIKAGRV